MKAVFAALAALVSFLLEPWILFLLLLLAVVFILLKMIAKRYHK